MACAGLSSSTTRSFESTFEPALHSRVSLDSIVYAFLGGQTAEAIGQAFPVLTLEQVYGALTFYLAHRETVDEHLAARRGDIEEMRQAARAADPMFYQKLAAARRTPVAS